MSEPTTGQLIQKVVDELEQIAKRNGDDFSYTIDITPSPNGLLFEFRATEQADDHDFVTGMGSTIDEAINNAVADIPDAAEEWGYDL